MGAGCACLSQALSEVISVPFRLERRGLVLRFPLAVSAAMGVFCVCEPDRAAVVDREPLPCDCGVGGGMVKRGGKNPPRLPHPPASLAPGIASLSRRSLAPHKKISGAKEQTDEAENALKNPQKNIGEHRQKLRDIITLYVTLCRFPTPKNPKTRINTALADGGGFEPPIPFGIHAFQACAIDHSATHPLAGGC